MGRFSDWEKPGFFESSLPPIEIGRCNVCAYYAYYEGSCRRRAPVVSLQYEIDKYSGEDPQPVSHEGRWPDTKEDDFCGEFAHLSRVRVADDDDAGWPGVPRADAKGWFDQSERENGMATLTFEDGEVIDRNHPYAEKVTEIRLNGVPWITRVLSCKVGPKGYVEGEVLSNDGHLAEMRNGKPVIQKLEGNVTVVAR